MRPEPPCRGRHSSIPPASTRTPHGLLNPASGSGSATPSHSLAGWHGAVPPNRCLTHKQSIPLADLCCSSRQRVCPSAIAVVRRRAGSVAAWGRALPAPPPPVAAGPTTDGRCSQSDQSKGCLPFSAAGTGDMPQEAEQQGAAAPAAAAPEPAALPEMFLFRCPEAYGACALLSLACCFIPRLHCGMLLTSRLCAPAPGAFHACCCAHRPCTTAPPPVCLQCTVCRPPQRPATAQSCGM